MIFQLIRWTRKKLSNVCNGHNLIANFQVAIISFTIFSIL
jgi:hypothetical protein